MWEQFLAMKLAELQLQGREREGRRWESARIEACLTRKWGRRAGLAALLAGAAWAVIFALGQL